MIPETAKVLRQLAFVSVDHDLAWTRGREASPAGGPGPGDPHQLRPRVSLTSWPRNQESARL